jgi:hypothetical protein
MVAMAFLHMDWEWEPSKRHTYSLKHALPHDTDWQQFSFLSDDKP